MNGNRKILFVFACTLVIVSCSANAQQFSASSDYASFYAPRYNVKLDNEPTIAIWWLIEKFSDTDWSRQRLHDELIRFSERYPNSPEHVERAKWHVQTLARMLDEKRPPEEKRILE